MTAAHISLMKHNFFYHNLIMHCT